jgi:hypothetical protein
MVRKSKTAAGARAAGNLVIDKKDLPEGRGSAFEDYLQKRVLEHHGLRVVIDFGSEILAEADRPYEHMCLLALNKEFEPVIIDGRNPEVVSVMESIQFYFEYVMRAQDVSWTDLTAWHLWAALAFREVDRVLKGGAK